MNKSIFTQNILESMVQITPQERNADFEDTILEKLKKKVEGKCDSFGYIKPGSCQILKRSIGRLQQGQWNGACTFKVTYSVEVCNPVEGMIVKCKVKNINKMGIFCVLADIDPSPLNLILAKQHHLQNEKFENVKIHDIISVEVVGIKFNYNDDYISCIGVLSDNNLTLEEQMEEDEIEIELNQPEDDEMEEGELSVDKDSEEESMSEGEESQVSGKSNLSEAPEGLTLEKVLIQEEQDVLENLKSTEIENLDGDEGEEVNMLEMEGVQDLESVDLTSKAQEDENKTQVLEDSEITELGDDFEGEKLDLEDISRQNLNPVSNLPEMENPEKNPGKEVFELEVLSHPKYKTFPKPRKNSKKFLNYFIYVQLNNMMIKFYQENGVEVKKVFLNKNHKFFDQIKTYLSLVGKSLQVEEVDGTSYVL